MPALAGRMHANRSPGSPARSAGAQTMRGGRIRQNPALTRLAAQNPRPPAGQPPAQPHEHSPHEHSPHEHSPHERAFAGRVLAVPGLPMLPVTRGNEFTRLQVLLYAIILLAVGRLAALMLSAGVIGHAFKPELSAFCASACRCGLRPCGRAMTGRV